MYFKGRLSVRTGYTVRNALKFVSEYVAALLGGDFKKLFFAANCCSCGELRMPRF
jgi:hypothetical protein